MNGHEVFHTGDPPGIYLASPGAAPIEMAHFSATVLIDFELALRARSRVRATTRADHEIFSGKNRGVLDVTDGNFIIFVTYTGIGGQDMSTGTMTQATYH